MKNNFTCANRKFKTNINKGYKHLPEHDYLGNAFKEPLFNENNCSLFLEHVVDIKSGEENLFWFMWYKNGKPIINASAVFDKEDLIEISQNIKELL